MNWPTGRDIIFSLRTFAAGMLALYIGMALNLPRPYWALLTAYIVSQPLSGMVRSKGLYRVLGTVLGASFGVMVLVALSTAPELVTLAMALWVGLCAYCSVDERSPASYGFLLAGLTAAVVVFPSVDSPGNIFNVALARCEEITLGVLCATLVGDVVFPQRVGPVLVRRLRGWATTAEHAFAKILTGEASGLADLPEARTFVGESDQLRMLQIQAAYDTQRYRAAAGWVTLLQRRMQLLFAILVSIDDRQRTLRQRRPELLREIEPLRRDVARYVGDPAAGPSQAKALRAAIDEAMPAPETLRQDWDRLLFYTLLARLRDLVTRWEESRGFRNAAVEGRPAPRTGESLIVHRDHLMAAVAGAAASIVVLVNATFWIGTEWATGGSAIVLATVAASFFSAADDPAPLARNFGVVVVLGSLLMLFYKFAVFPMIDGFPLLAVSMAPVYLAAGLLAGQPAFGPLALLTAVIFTALTALSNSPSANFESSVNGAIASIVGISFAFLSLRITRPLGAELVVRRLVASNYRDLARVAAGDPRIDRDWFESRSVDRLAGLIQRLGDTGWRENGRVVRSLAELRVGLSLFRLRDAEPGLPADLRPGLSALREALHRHFRARVRKPDIACDAVVEPLDAAIARTAAAEVRPATTEALLALAGIRQGMLPGASAAPPVLPPSGEPASRRLAA